MKRTATSPIFANRKINLLVLEFQEETKATKEEISRQVKEERGAASEKAMYRSEGAMGYFPSPPC